MVVSFAHLAGRRTTNRHGMRIVDAHQAFAAWSKQAQGLINAMRLARGCRHLSGLDFGPITLAELHDFAVQIKESSQRGLFVPDPILINR